MADRPRLSMTAQAFHTFAEATPFPVYVASFDGGVLLLANRALRDAFRFPADPVGQQASDLFAAPAQCAALLARLEAEGSLAREDARMRRADGSEFWALVSCGMLDFDGRRARLTSLVDIDALKSNERRLAESERLLERVFDTIPQPVAVKDSAGRYVRVNPTFCSYTGVRPADLVGRRPDEIDNPRPEAAAILEEDRLVLSGEVDRLDAEVVRTFDGTEHILAISKAPIVDDAGAIAGTVEISIEMTEYRRIERELARHRDRLEEIVRERTAELEQAHREVTRSEHLAAIGRVIGTVSHELRNPIGTLQMTFATLRPHLEGEPALDRAVERMDRNIRRCALVIQELLAYSRAREPELAETELDPWVAHLTEDVQIPDGIELRLDPHAGGLRVMIDRQRLHQAVTNAVVNAVQALAGQAAPDRRPCVVLATRRGPNGATIEISDNGPGIPPELHERIFEPLFSTKELGVGLGLPLVRQVMHEHGGSVEVVSAPGAGATIRLHLPDKRSEEGSRSE